MKNMFIILALFFFIHSLVAQQEKQVIFILKDGSSKHYNISDIDSITVIKTGDSSKFTFHDSTGDSSQSFYLRDINKISFGDSNKIAFELADTTIYMDMVDIDSMTISPPAVLESVTIGNQVWMTKNLAVSRYSNGDSIPYVSDSLEWVNLKTGAWCYYNNDPANEAIYGKLYNWYAASDPRGLAPAGWHVPNYSEWTALVTELGDDDLAGGKLKEAGTMHWQSPNTGATNESGFTALPGGFRNFDGTFSLLGQFGAWWTSEQYDALFAYCRYMSYDNIKAPRFVARLLNGFSIRCIRD